MNQKREDCWKKKEIITEACLIIIAAYWISQKRKVKVANKRNEIVKEKEKLG